MIFASQVFLVALVAAAGPLIIHLLNRQRYRTIDWAPMEFLLQAVRRRRRRLQLRDLLLLLLRTLAMVFFVLAMARPIWTTQGSSGYAGQPVHTVLVFDNSLSMAYTPLDKSRLEMAKDKARQFIRHLPSGSDVTVLPMCEQSDARFSKVYDSKEDAMDAVARIGVVDRIAHFDGLPASVERVLSQSGTAPTKLLVVFSDMQQATWAQANEEMQMDVWSDAQFVAVRSREEGALDENSWVESLRLRGGFAESGVPAVFDVVIRHEGSKPRQQVRIVLTVDGEVAGEQLVNLQPGASRKMTFDYTFEALGGVVNPAFIPVHVELENDRLAADDRRCYVAPVFKRAPVLFVDQQGDFEQPGQNRFGETWPLRVLYTSRLGTRPDTVGHQPHLQPVTLDSVTPEQLKDVRLVVIAGVSSPSPNQVKLLRQFVERGGQLLIAAGAEFDAQQWTAVAWNEEGGILPAPLTGQMLGALPKPGSSEEDRRFYLNPTSLHRDVFDLQLSNDDWNDLVRSSFFYQAVRVESQPNADDGHTTSVGHVIPNGGGAAGPNGFGRLRVVGRFDNGAVFAVHREVGEGNVILVTTSCFPSWNNLAVQPGILLYDRMVKWLIDCSIPERNFVQRSEHFLPVDRRDQQHQFELISSTGRQNTVLEVEAVGADQFAVVARGVDQRDVYAIHRRDTGDGSSTEIYSFAVNGPTEESQLACVVSDTFPSRDRWLGTNDTISLAGGAARRDLWLYLLGLAAACLLAEMLVASVAFRRQTENAEAPV